MWPDFNFSETENLPKPNIMGLRPCKVNWTHALNYCLKRGRLQVARVLHSTFRLGFEFGNEHYQTFPIFQLRNGMFCILFIVIHRIFILFIISISFFLWGQISFLEFGKQSLGHVFLCLCLQLFYAIIFLFF